MWVLSVHVSYIVYYVHVNNSECGDIYDAIHVE